MGKEIEPLKAVNEQIKERIKAEFAQLIPDELWTKMVSEVTGDFLKNTLRSMIQEELESQARGAIKATLGEMRPQWGGRAHEAVSEAVKKIVAENLEDLMRSVQKGMSEMIVQMAVNKMRESMNMY